MDPWCVDLSRRRVHRAKCFMTPPLALFVHSGSYEGSSILCSARRRIPARSLGLCGSEMFFAISSPHQICRIIPMKYDVRACVCQHTGRSRFSFSVATEIEGSGSSASGSPQTMPTAQRPSRVPGPRTWLGFG